MARDINQRLQGLTCQAGETPNASLQTEHKAKMSPRGTRHLPARRPETQGSPSQAQAAGNRTSLPSERKELSTRIPRTCRPRPGESVFRNDSESRRPREMGEVRALLSSRPALRESLSKGLSARRGRAAWSVKKGDSGDKGNTISSVPLEFPRLCLTVEAYEVILSTISRNVLRK